MQVYEFIGGVLYIGDDVHCYPAISLGTYFMQDKGDMFLMAVDDFGDLVRLSLAGATQRAAFRQTLH